MTDRGGLGPHAHDTMADTPANPPVRQHDFVMRTPPGQTHVPSSASPPVHRPPVIAPAAFAETPKCKRRLVFDAA